MAHQSCPRGPTDRALLCEGRDGVGFIGWHNQSTAETSLGRLTRPITSSIVGSSPTSAKI